MPAALSDDLRRRVVDAVLVGNTTQAEVAQRFAVSLTSVESWSRRYRVTGSVEPTPQRHGPKRLLSGDDDRQIAAYLDADNGLTLIEIVAQFAVDTGRRLSQTTVFRSLARGQMTLKKRHSGPPSA